MTLSNYRFLPFTRRGLVTQAENVDPLTGALPRGRAAIRVAVSVAVNGGATIAAPALSVYGPGDVTGFDTRVIVRAEPRPGTHDFEPNYLAAVDFDAPDFPWMLTPAAPHVASGNRRRLRPWLVLVVFDRERVKPPRAALGRPLPFVEIAAEHASSELPELTESWAWAHAQLSVPDGFDGSLANELSARPDVSVSRLICPRRLERERRYVACLVPAFDQGMQRGLGGEPASSAELAPAWVLPATGTLTLPVYFHWEFATGPGGDFEQLARKLKPTPPAAGLGYQRAYLAPEQLEVPDLGPGKKEAYTWMEGALRARQGSGTPAAGEAGAALSTIPKAFRDQLGARLNERVSTSAGALAAVEPLRPPIYGGPPINQYQVDAALTKWLEQLNLDPRMRAAAGLGAEMVRKHQEAFMQACWEQVGDVLKANELLSRMRLAQETGDRIFRRFFSALGADRLSAVLSPVLDRLPFAQASTIRSALRASSLPDATFDPALRRLLSPTRGWVRSALRRGALRNAGTVLAIGPALNASRPESDPTAVVPDGIVGTRLLDEFPEDVAMNLSLVGFDVVLPRVRVARLKRSVRAAANLLGRFTPLTLDPSLTSGGVVLDLHVLEARTKADLALQSDRPEIGATQLLQQLRSEQRRTRAQPLASPPAARPGKRSGPTSDGTVTPFPDDGDITFPDDGIDIPDDIEITVPDDLRVPDPPIRLSRVLDRYGHAFDRYAVDADLTRPPPQTTFRPFRFAAARQAMLERIEPMGSLRARVGARISIDGVALTNAPAGVRTTAAQDRVLVGPGIEDALYRYLADYDPSRFLPGVTDIEPDSVMLLTTNQRFVDAFLIGANHEMNRELNWRNYPTDSRNTVFRRFWPWAPGSFDIPEIHTLARGATLGAFPGRPVSSDQAVFLLRSQLLRRYPGTVVLAWRGELRDGRQQLRANPAAADVRTPVFSGRFEPDFTFFGFPLTLDEINAGGWFFVLQQPPTEPRFGFDSPEADQRRAIASWLDATWSDAGVAEGAFLRLAGNPLAGLTLGGVSFGRDAAHVAAMLLQRPFRAAFDAQRLLQGARG